MVLAASPSCKSESTPLVSVLVPAYNAARTLGETLESVRRQTYANIDIVVVDDGSSDSTPDLVAEAAGGDRRIRLIQQPNRGLALARNRALHEARGELVAPLDADDLWHPNKLAQQVWAMERAGAQVGFVYCAFRRIDQHSHVIGHGTVFRARGPVLHQHLLTNFVGNGSAILARRSLVLACGGYDPSLREIGLEGVEDYLLQLRLAESAEVEVVPEYLVGYRQHARAMSADTQRMARAYAEVLRRVQRRCAGVPPQIFSWNLAAYLSHCAFESLHQNRRRAALALAAQSVRSDPLEGGRLLWSGVRAYGTSAFKRKLLAGPTRTSACAPRHFYQYEPTDGLRAVPEMLAPRLASLANLDKRHARTSPTHGAYVV